MGEGQARNSPAWPTAGQPRPAPPGVGASGELWAGGCSRGGADGLSVASVTELNQPRRPAYRRHPSTANRALLPLHALHSPQEIAFIGASMDRPSSSPIHPQPINQPTHRPIDPPQEIVFIGASMDRPAIEAQLDSALLTDAGAGALLSAVMQHACVQGCWLVPCGGRG